MLIGSQIPPQSARQWKCTPGVNILARLCWCACHCYQGAHGSQLQASAFLQSNSPLLFVVIPQRYYILHLSRLYDYINRKYSVRKFTQIVLPISIYATQLNSHTAQGTHTNQLAEPKPTKQQKTFVGGYTGPIGVHFGDDI